MHIISSLANATTPSYHNSEDVSLAKGSRNLCTVMPKPTPLLDDHVLRDVERIRWILQIMHNMIVISFQ